MSVPRRPGRPAIAGLLAALALAGCATSEAVSDGPVRVPVTVGGVGQLPEPLSGEDEVSGAGPVADAITVPPVTRALSSDPIGARARGNRLLVIGDSITASTARRHGGEMCFALLPLGWAVEVNAEVSRFVDFGHRVLDRRLRPAEGADWDAAVVFLGTNYGGDADRYRAELEGILDRLAPRPTILVTVTEFRPDRAQVNAVIRELGLGGEHLAVLEWAEITRADRSLLAPDGIHLSAEGRARLVRELAELLGPAPDPDIDPDPDVDPDVATDPDGPEAASGRPAGECLPTSFTDDSAGRQPGAAPPPVTLVGGDRPASSAPTTSSPGTTTPARPTPSSSPGGTNPTTTPATPATTAPGTGPADTTQPTTEAPSDPDPGSGEAPPSSATTVPASPTSAPATTAPATTAPATTAPPATTTAPAADPAPSDGG